MGGGEFFGLNGFLGTVTGSPYDPKQINQWMADNCTIFPSDQILGFGPMVDN
jgi:hypothetical protein